MIDFLKLLKLLKVPNVPSSWYKLKQIINKSERKSKQENLVDLTLYFCPECENESSNGEKCTNKNCSYNKNILASPHAFMVMNIERQIQQILATIKYDDLHLPISSFDSSTPSEMTDIYDGHVYATIRHTVENECSSKFLTLTCNVDGVTIYTSSQNSMWTFIACINEIKRKSRFSIENIIGKYCHRFKY